MLRNSPKTTLISAAKLALSLAFAVLGSLACHAADEAGNQKIAEADADSIPLAVLRPVASAYSLEFGPAHIADTYLTPLHYRGERSSIRYERNQAMRFSPENWTMQLKVGGTVARTKNPAGNATMLHAAVQGSWCMMRRHRLPCGITVGCGPGISLDLGVLYLSRNGNNPASAKAACTIDASGYASWHGRIGHLPFTLRYQPTLPLTGIFFSPDYGQLYYQIYLGQDNGLVHTAWWGNYFSLDNLFTADFHFGNTSLRLGYHGTVLSSKVNDIVWRDISHAVVLGVTIDWVSLSPTDHSLRRARLIQSY